MPKTMIALFATTFVFALPVAAKADSIGSVFGAGLTVTAPDEAETEQVLVHRDAIYTPAAAAVSLKALGYARISLLLRTPSVYVFSAVNLSDGQHYVLTVTTRRGELIQSMRR